MNRSHRYVLLAALTVGLVGCSSAPKPSSASLDLATETYNRVANNPDIAQLAPLELQKAQQSLAQTQSLWQNNAAPEEVDHAAYITTREAEIAEQTAKMKAAQNVVDNAEIMRHQALVEARDREAEAANQRADRLQAGTEDLQQQLDRQRDQQGMVLILDSDILFDNGQSALRADAFTPIQKVATFLKENPERRTIVVGYTDNVGDASFNQRLSQQRAESVRDLLIQNGVPAAQVESRGRGDSSPVASNDDAIGRQQNRRIELIISNPNQP